MFKFIAARTARRGARFLDRHEAGWATFVNPRTVCIASGTDCVLGQIAIKRYNRYGWYYMTDRLAINAFLVLWLGFMPSVPGLDRAWAREIQARRSAPVRRLVHTLAA